MDELHASYAAHLPWPDRVAKSIYTLEKGRDDRRRDDGVIGNVLDKARREDRIHIKSKTVNFSWQRGVKIGQGHFGKVYTAINNETGDIMAMKEIPLQPNDHKTLRNVADELRIFESIHHKHLINHYGVEVRRRVTDPEHRSFFRVVAKSFSTFDRSLILRAHCRSIERRC